ncbi:MAG: hypothetical protein KDD73_17035 [Anaerolineales bacterium]|nr:hypothetical protein [Anaerolineales bacterium]
MTTSNRRQAGLALAARRGAVVQVAADPWRMASQPEVVEGYTVTRHSNVEGETVYECSCADYTYRLLKCKHIHAALDYQVAEAYVISLFIGGNAARIEVWLERYRRHCLHRSDLAGCAYANPAPDHGCAASWASGDCT